MTINKRMLFLLFFSQMFYASISLAYNTEFTHTAFGDTPGRIESRLASDGQTTFTVPYIIETMGIQQSSSGKLGYLERTDYRKKALPCAWVVEKKENQSDQFSKLFKVDAIPLILHICDAKGTDIKRIPIPQRYGCQFENLVFYGENFVGLRFGGRLIPQASETFVDLRTDKIFSLHYRAGFESWGASLTPDGNSLLISVSMKDENLPDQLLINGRTIYPFLEKEAMFASDNPDEFEKKMNRIRQFSEDRKKQGKANPTYYGMSDAMWAKDGRSFVLLERDNERFRLLKFNLDAIASDKPFEEYCKPLREIESPEKQFSGGSGLHDIRIVYDSETEEVQLGSWKKYLERLEKEGLRRE